MEKGGVDCMDLETISPPAGAFGSTKLLAYCYKSTFLPLQKYKY
jgi:hypothetical protein